MPDNQEETNNNNEIIVARCGGCGLYGRVPFKCITRNIIECPKCGLQMVREENVDNPNSIEEIDLTQFWVNGRPGRCSNCGFIARVNENVRKENNQFKCEMCLVGSFEFYLNIPRTERNAPTPKPVYLHDIDGLQLNLSRRCDVETLRMLLTALRDGLTPNEIINSTGDIAAFIEADHITIHAVNEILRVENERRWELSEPLLYPQSEIERLNSIRMLKVPLPGRIKIQFACSRGPVRRWIHPTDYNQLVSGESRIVYDGKFKIIKTSEINQSERWDAAINRYFTKTNSALEIGILRAWSPTNELLS